MQDAVTEKMFIERVFDFLKPLPLTNICVKLEFVKAKDTKYNISVFIYS